MKKRSGFTLIELLVVISIISILSVVGFVAYQNVTLKAKDARMKADIDAIKKAYETNYISEGQGRYQPLAASQFANGKIPVQPNGSPYPCSIGPDTSCTFNPDNGYDNADQGYRVSATLSDGGTYAATSAGGTLASGGGMNSCDPLGVLSTGLIGYWKMDEGSGNTIADSSGSNNGAWNGTGSHWSTTIPNSQFVGSAIFNGTDDYINIGNPATFNFGTGDFTIAFWIKGSAQPFNTIPLGKGNEDCISSGYRFNTNPGTSIKLAISDGTGSAGCTKTRYTPETTGVLDNTWHHITGVVSRSGVTKTMVIFKDGVKGSPGSIPSDFVSVSNNSGLAIGKNSSSGGGNFTGLIDDVRIYNRALSDSEVSLLGSGCL